MASSILNRIRQFDKLIVLQAKVGEGGSPLYNLSQFERKGPNVKLFRKSDEWKEDVIEFEEFDLHLPALLLTTGKGVLIRETQSTGENLLNAVMPGVQNSDYVYVSGDVNGRSYVSFSRKNQIEDISSNLLRSGVQIVAAIPGFGSVIELCELVLPEKDTVILGDWKYESGKGISLKGDESNSASYRIGGEDVTSNLLPAYLSAIMFWMEVGMPEWQPESVLNLKEEYQYKAQYKKLLISGVFVLFALVLVNYFYATFLQRQESALNTQMGYKKPMLDRVQLLENEITEKTRLLSSMGLTSIQRFSYVADQIAASVPTEISLQRLAIRPLKGKVKENEEISFMGSSIIVMGDTQKGSAVNIWLDRLSKESWAKHVEVINYETREGVAHFELEIEV